MKKSIPSLSCPTLFKDDSDVDSFFEPYFKPILQYQLDISLLMKKG
jgi:hypothetical protein